MKREFRAAYRLARIDSRIGFSDVWEAPPKGISWAAWNAAKCCLLSLGDMKNPYKLIIESEKSPMRAIDRLALKRERGVLI